MQGFLLKNKSFKAFSVVKIAKSIMGKVWHIRLIEKLV